MQASDCSLPKGDLLLICPEFVNIVQGGLVNRIYSSRRQVQAAMIDGEAFDSEGDPRIARTKHQTRQVKAHESLDAVESLNCLPGSDAEPILLTKREDA